MEEKKLLHSLEKLTANERLDAVQRMIDQFEEEIEELGTSAHNLAHSTTLMAKAVDQRKLEHHRSSLSSDRPLVLYEFEE